MFNLKFKLDKYYLFVHALSVSETPFPAWENLQNRLWEKFPKAYYLLTNHPETAFIGASPLNELRKTYKQVEEMIEVAFRSKEFRKIYKESKKYHAFIENQWKKNGAQALAIIEELSGLSMPQKTITVYITYPKFYRGFAMLSENTIGFGYEEDYKNSSITNLCHEIMHHMVKNTRTMHALIELLANNELRIRLNKKGKYFEFQESGGTKISHLHHYVSRMRDFEKKILPFWKEYIKNRHGRTIIDLEKEINKK